MICPGFPVCISKTDSSPLEPNQDISYVLHATTLYLCSVKHLVQQINSLMRMYGMDSDQMLVSSYEPTRASLWSIFGSGSARKEAGKLLARPEYFNKMPDNLTEITAYLRGQVFRDRQAPKEFTIHRSHGVRKLERGESDISWNSLTPTMGPDLA